MIGFCTSLRFVEHLTGPHHPERPDRIRAISRAVREAGLIDSPDPFPDFGIELGPLPPAPAKLMELAPKTDTAQYLPLVHTPRHIQLVERVCRAGGGVLDLGDTPVGASSYDIALLSLGGALACCDAVMAGQVRRAFAVGRPPGHHAEPDRPMGFCLFSNVAIAARYLQKQHGIERVAIVDFDVHHGNGTQAAFESDPSVLFISLHQNPRTCYPGSGYDWERGSGPGEGYTLNLPFDPGTDDADYLPVFESRVLPALDAYKPQFLLVSAGFDAHREDPLAQLNLSEDAFAQITRLLRDRADALCGGRLVSCLEGGYNLRALARSVVQHLIALH